MTDFAKHVLELLADVDYRDNYTLLVEKDKVSGGRIYMQVECQRPDAATGVMGVGRGGKRYLSEHMTDGEILRIAFSSLMAYEEHECREFFKYKGRAIFGPHIDPLALYEVADRLDVRQ